MHDLSAAGTLYVLVRDRCTPTASYSVVTTEFYVYYVTTTQQSTPGSGTETRSKLPTPAIIFHLSPSDVRAGEVKKRTLKKL